MYRLGKLTQEEETDKMDDGNNAVAESSERNEGAIEELLAVGGENLQVDAPQDDTDSEPEKSLASERRMLAAARTSSGDASESVEQCSCGNNGSSSQTQCMFCGEEATAKSRIDTTNSPPGRVSTQGHLLNVLTRSHAVGCPSLPDSSLEDYDGCSSFEQFQCLVTGRSRQEKTPVDNVCEFSMQVPSPGMTIRIFLFERTYPERNEKSFFLYMIPEEKCELYEEILRDFREATMHEGFSRQIPFTVNNGRCQDFHTVCIQERITVAFEIENTFQENYVAINQRNESVFRVPVIKSDSQSRVAKGSKCQFMVQYVGETGKPCQEQGKITLKIDSTDQTTIYFSIAIWSSLDIRVEGDQPGQQ